MKGNIPEVPNQYSLELKSLVKELLEKDPEDRPSINNILERPFMQVFYYNLKKSRVNIMM